MTERLILRNFVETDYDDLYEFLFQRKGYATEAIQAVMGNAFEHGVHRVFAE